MKKIVLTLISVIGLLLPQITPAQGTLYLSNLDQPSVATTSVGSDSWRALSFNTGTNSLGYILNSIQLLMGPASGNPSGFNAKLYSEAAYLPGSSLGSLVGSDPATGGLYTYMASSITLSPNTHYFVVLTAGTLVAGGSYSWSIASTSNYSVSDGWNPDGGYYRSTDGISWGGYRPNPFQYAVDATAIPEPTTAVLAGFGLVCLSFLRRKRELVQDN